MAIILLRGPKFHVQRAARATAALPPLGTCHFTPANNWTRPPAVDRKKRRENKRRQGAPDNSRARHPWLAEYSGLSFQRSRESRSMGSACPRQRSRRIRLPAKRIVGFPDAAGLFVSVSQTVSTRSSIARSASLAPFFRLTRSMMIFSSSFGRGLSCSKSDLARMLPGVPR